MKPGPRKPVALLLHLYEARLAEEFAGALGHLDLPFAIYVNQVCNSRDDADTERQSDTVRRAFPDATIILSDNRGMDVGGMFRLFERVCDEDHEALLYMHGKSDARWRRGMLHALTAAGTRASEIASWFRDVDHTAPVGMVGAYLFPFDYFNIGPFLELMEQLNVSLTTDWDRYFARFPTTRSLPLEQRIAHARDMGYGSLRPEIDLEYAHHLLGDLHGKRQPMNRGLYARMRADGVLGQLPYFPGNFFWISMRVIRMLSLKLDFGEEFRRLEPDLASDRKFQSRAHAWERALPAFAAGNDFTLVGLQPRSSYRRRR